ncbi:MAG TPA: adenylate/guanylate cyclase domain-containing protein [Firmicutes bacterium]|nr:adenylate/guanylate cyclase domain-containing protein [Bacillota bacterium]
MGLKKKRTPLKGLFIFSCITGILISFSYDTINIFFTGLVLAVYPGIKPYEEIAGNILAGIIAFGIMIYVFSNIAVSSFSFEILKYFSSEMRAKHLLNFKQVKLIKSKKLKDSYNGIINIFDSFLHLFMCMKQDREKFSKTIETYLDPALKRDLETRSVNEIYLGGKKKNAAIFFSDLRGFTAFSEAHSPDIVISILNDYFTAATKIIGKNRGSVNKYIGDAVLGVFEENPRYIDYIDADKAVIAALDIQAAFEVMLTKWKKEIDPAIELGLGIGIAWGGIVAGNMGSEERMEYTVIGDTVNLASRLCDFAVHGQVIISEETYRRIQDLLIVDELPPIKVKGKTGMYKTYLVKTRKMLV